jgi:hypothetical protein
MQTTNTTPRRIVYFRGHEKQKESALITIDLECSMRTVADLYNLQVVRGNIVDGVLDLESSMSGPHHYYGYLDPFASYTVSIEDGHPRFFKQRGRSKKLNKLSLPNGLSNSLGKTYLDRRENNHQREG